MPPKPLHLLASPARAADATPGPGSAPAPPAAAVSSQRASVERAAAVALHAQGQRLDAAQHQEAVERPGDRADRVLQEAEPLAQSALAVAAADDGDAADHVGVAVQVLGGRVHDDVEAELERPLHPGAGEGVVGHARGCRARGRSRRSPPGRPASAAGWSASRPTPSGSRAAARPAARRVGEVDEAEARGRRCAVRTRSNRRNVPP